MGKIVEIQNLTFAYNSHVIFNELSLNISEGSFYTILGKTGSGKSTLARILMGLEETHDYIKIHDLYLNPKNMEEIRQKTNIVYENPELEFVTDSVFEELAFSLQSLGYSEDEIKKKINLVSEDFSINHLLSRNPHKLSAGEKELISLAVNVITSPKLLILDEALSMIDKKTKKRIWEVLRKYQQEMNMTILHFTDYPEDILEGTNIVILADGKVALQENIFASLQSEKAFTNNQLELPFLVNLSNKLRYYGTIPALETDIEQLVDAIWK